MTSPIEIRRIGLIGFGEAGTIIGTELKRVPDLEIVTYDILLDDPNQRETIVQRTNQARVALAESLPDALRDSQLVISAVTATSAFEVAVAAARTLTAGQIFLDINSVSPETKREDCKAVECSGAYYVEAAVMGPFPPQRLKVQILLGGSRAEQLAPVLNSFGMRTTAVSDQIGVASAIKMCRSVMIKGIEALSVECLFAARRYGAERLVLESLNETYPDMGWLGRLPNYLVSRVAEHGRRRAAEMREVAQTLSASALAPLMASATAERQDWLVDEMETRDIVYSSSGFNWQKLADVIALDPEPVTGAAKEINRRGAGSANSD